MLYETVGKGEGRLQEVESLYAALPEKLLPWYRANARALPWRENTDPYRVWVSEIMLQQTRVEAVIGYYERFLRALPDVYALARAPQDELLKLWEGLGYYSRVRNLQKAAVEIVQTRGGRFPDTAQEIAKLPGIGAYTAGAIASICFERAAAAVDGNVVRIVARITGDGTPADSPRLKREIAARLQAVYPPQGRGDFTQALMELGAIVCTPRAPQCGRCPMQTLCVARRSGRTAELPVMPTKKSKKAEPRTVFLLECGGRLALTRRPERGLLAGLWALPECAGALTPGEALDTLRGWGVQPLAVDAAAEKKHVFTHVVWQMRCYRAACAAAPARFLWAAPQELEAQYALPTAYRQFLRG